VATIDEDLLYNGFAFKGELSERLAVLRSLEEARKDIMSFSANMMLKFHGFECLERIDEDGLVWLCGCRWNARGPGCGGAKDGTVALNASQVTGVAYTGDNGNEMFDSIPFTTIDTALCANFTCSGLSKQNSNSSHLH
jgi:hypothetical protein